MVLNSAMSPSTHAKASAKTITMTYRITHIQRSFMSNPLFLSWQATLARTVRRRCVKVPVVAYAPQPAIAYGMNPIQFTTRLVPIRPVEGWEGGAKFVLATLEAVTHDSSHNTFCIPSTYSHTR